MIAKEHIHSDGRVVIAVCDKELIGKKFSEGDKQLDFTSDFYKGKEMSPLLIGDMLRNADSASLAGHKSTQLGLEEGIIEKDQIITIDGIPFATAALEKAF